MGTPDWDPPDDWVSFVLCVALFVLACVCASILLIGAWEAII